MDTFTDVPQGNGVKRSG